MINLKVNEQKLEIEDTEYLANKSHNYLKIKFNFTGDSWEDKNKFCLIKTRVKKTFNFPLINDEVILPSSVLKEKYFKLSVYGTAGDNENYIRITTNQIRMKLSESGYTENLSPIDPQPSRDIFAIIFEELDKKINYSDVEDELDLDSDLPVTNKRVTAELNSKSNIGHTHNSNEVTGINEVAEFEIKKAYRILTNKILTYGE